MGIPKDKLTEGQKREVERLRQFVSRNRFTVRMNSTRWRDAIDAVMEVAAEGYAPRYRVRCITDPADPPLDGWLEGFPQGLPLYNAIEWLELHPQGVRPPGSPKGTRAPSPKQGPGFGEALKAALAKAGIPLAESSTGIRIVGHSRPGQA